MGCWNGTCAITNLPIFYGDPVRYVLLAETPGYARRSRSVAGGFCYPTGMWAPLGAPLRGFYDDYGRVDNVKYGFNEDVIRERLFHGILPTKTNHGDPVGPTDDWGRVLSWVERGVVKFKHIIDNKETAVGQAMIHEDIYEEMLRFEYTSWHSEKPVNAATIRAEGRAYLAQIVKDIEKDKADPKGASLRAMMRSTGDDERAQNSFEETLHYLRDGDNYRCYDAFIREKVAAGVRIDDERLTRLTDDLADFFFIQGLMSRSRKFWSPQSGAGSQGDNFDIYKHLNEAVRTHIAAVEKKRGEDQ